MNEQIIKSENANSRLAGLALLASILLATGCPSTGTDAPTLRPIGDRSVTGGSRILDVSDLNTVLVVSATTATSRLGECTDYLANPLNVSCTKREVQPDNVYVHLTDHIEPRAFGTLSSYSPSNLRPIDLNNGEIRTFNGSVSIDTSAGFSAFGSGGTAVVAVKRFQVVYEWSQTASISVDSERMSDDVPYVAAANYGFAARLVFDAAIYETQATIDLNLGPAQLDAALALGISTVSARYQFLGSNAPIFPQEAFTIDTAAALEQAVSAFRDQTTRMQATWNDACLSQDARTVPYSNDGRPSSSPPPGPETAEARILRERLCSIRPTLISYQVRGRMIGNAVTNATAFHDACLVRRSRDAAEGDGDRNPRYAAYNCEYDAISTLRCIAEYGAEARVQAAENSDYNVCYIRGSEATEAQSVYKRIRAAPEVNGDTVVTPSAQLTRSTMPDLTRSSEPIPSL